jgi:hypothetical protein
LNKIGLRAWFERMAEEEAPEAPTPKPIDEQKAMEARHIIEDCVLRAVPYGDERCSNCLFYLNPDDELSYCWHPKLRILVGTTWWCQWWEKID